MQTQQLWLGIMSSSKQCERAAVALVRKSCRKDDLVVPPLLSFPLAHHAPQVR